MFKVEAFFNPYLAAGVNRLDAVVTVTSDMGVEVKATADRQLVGFTVDCSGSMGGEKLAAAKLAARRGIDLLDENTWFFVLRFHTEADVLIVPTRATPDAKAMAHRLIQNIRADGGTCMSAALFEAKKVVTDFGKCIASNYFLCDGQNDRSDKNNLDRAIEACKGVFQCDCRGVGTDWRADELRLISNALMGSADAICDPSNLEADFSAFLGRVSGKGINGVRLRLWSPKVVSLAGMKQVSPEIVDLQGHMARIDEKTIEFPLGSWGKEARDYQLVFNVPAGNVGEEILACRPTLIYTESGVEKKVTCEPVVSAWSDDASLTTRINKEVAHYNGQGELAEVIQEGLEAKAKGDDDRATRLLGRAAHLAETSGNEEVTRRLKKVVDIIDPAAGTVRLRRADKSADLELEMGGTRTVRRRPATQSGS